MRKELLSGLLAWLAVGMAWGYTPAVHTNSFVRDGVTYVQRGALGNAAYVVTNVAIQAGVDTNVVRQLVDASFDGGTAAVNRVTADYDDATNRIATIEGKESGWDGKQDAISDYTTTGAVVNLVKTNVAEWAWAGNEEPQGMTGETATNIAASVIREDARTNYLCTVAAADVNYLKTSGIYEDETNTITWAYGEPHFTAATFDRISIDVMYGDTVTEDGITARWIKPRLLYNQQDGEISLPSGEDGGTLALLSDVGFSVTTKKKTVNNANQIVGEATNEFTRTTVADFTTDTIGAHNAATGGVMNGIYPLFTHINPALSVGYSKFHGNQTFDPIGASTVQPIVFSAGASIRTESQNAITMGYGVLNTNNYSFVWSGDADRYYYPNVRYSTAYGTHLNGGFHINPKVRSGMTTPLENFWVGDKTMKYWIEELAPPSAVQSVNEQTGTVVLDAADVGAVPNDSAYTSVVNKANAAVPDTRTVAGKALSANVTLENLTINGTSYNGSEAKNITVDGMDYEAVTNTVNAVKAQFYDEPLQVNWTLKMVNGEMKLYATTNVNQSTL